MGKDSLICDIVSHSRPLIILALNLSLSDPPNFRFVRPLNAV